MYINIENLGYTEKEKGKHKNHLCPVTQKLPLLTLVGVSIIVEFKFKFCIVLFSLNSILWAPSHIIKWFLIYSDLKLPAYSDRATSRKEMKSVPSRRDLLPLAPTPVSFVVPITIFPDKQCQLVSSLSWMT